MRSIVAEHIAVAKTKRSEIHDTGVAFDVRTLGLWKAYQTKKSLHKKSCQDAYKIKANPSPSLALTHTHIHTLLMQTFVSTTHGW